MKEIGKERKIAIAALIVAVLMLTVAFAAMSRTLKINGTAKVDSAAWDIHFKSANMTSKKGDAREVVAPVIDNGGINLTLKVGLRKPKDEITYEAVIENKGDIDAEIESIEYPELNEDQAKIIEFVATYDDGSEISKSQELKATEEKTVKIVIRYKDITDESLLAKETYDIPLTFKINYIQKGQSISFDTESVPGTGEDIETDDDSKAVLAPLNFAEAMQLPNPTVVPFSNSPIERGKIETLSFEKGSNSVRSGNTWDASEAGDGSITGYYTDSDSNGLYEVVIESASNIYAPVDASGYFAAMVSLKEINFNNFKTTDTTNMMYMFAMNASLTSLNLSSFNTTNVTNMDHMFYGLTLTSLNVSNFDTRNVTNMSYVFQDCESLESLDLSTWNTSNVTTMKYMFGNCSSLTSLDINHFDTSNVTDMSAMFDNCSSLASLDLRSWGKSKVTDMSYMFQYCSSLISLDLSNFDTSNVTNMRYMFQNCTLLKNLYISSWNVENVTNMEIMFENCSSLTSLDLSNWNPKNVITFEDMFHNCYELVELKLNNAEFNPNANFRNMLYMVPSITIYVKNQAAIDSLGANISNRTYIIEPLES